MFIIFNTQKQALQYIKRRNRQLQPSPYDTESYHYLSLAIGVKNSIVLEVSGWQCGCGCDMGHTNATIVGRVKSNQLVKN